MARRALNGNPAPDVVYYPLGLEQRLVLVYKVIKASSFLFKTPKQQGAFVRAMAKFAEETSCGLELLALRRSRVVRREGSIADVAKFLYRLIREGEMNPTKALNLTRLGPELKQVGIGHRQEVEARKEAAFGELISTIDAAGKDEAATLTGLFVTARDAYRLRRAT